MEISIKNELLDLFPGEESENLLTIDFSFFDKSGQRQLVEESNSVPFSIPATNKNRQILQQFGAFDSSAEPLGIVQIMIGGITRKKGTAFFFKSKNFKNGIAREFELMFVFNSTAIWQQLESKTIAEALKEYPSFTLTTIGMEQKMNASPNGPLAVCYAPVNYGKWTGSPGTAIGIQEMTPAVFVKQLLNIFFQNINGIDYKVNAPFLDLDQFKYLCFPLTQLEYNGENARGFSNVKSVSLSVTSYTQSGAFIYISQTSDSSPNGFDVGGEFDPLNARFTAIVAGSYRITFNSLVSVLGTTTNSVTATFKIRENFAPISGGEQTVNSGPPQWKSVSISTEVYLNPGETVDIIAETKDQFGDINNTFELDQTFITVSPLQTYANVLNTVVYPYSMVNPNWTQLEFIRGLADIIPLVFAINEIKQTIDFGPPDDWAGFNFDGNPVFNSGLIRFFDGNKYLQVNKNWEGTRAQQETKLLSFEYKENSKPTDTFLKNLNGAGPAAGNFEFSNFEKAELKTKTNSFFVGASFVKDSRLKTPNGINPAHLNLSPFNLKDGDAPETNYKEAIPLLLYFRPRTGFDQTTPVEVYFSKQEFTTDTRISTFFSADLLFPYKDVGGPPFSLSFSDKTAEDGTEIPGLLSLFYISQLTSLNKGLRLKPVMNMNPAEINALSPLFSKVFFQNKRFFIKSIQQANPTRQSSFELELIQEIRVEPEDYSRIKSNDGRNFIEK